MKKTGKPSPRPTGKRSSRKGAKASPLRRRLKWLSAAAAAVGILYSALGTWYVSHSPDWLRENRELLPGFVAGALEKVGDPIADFCDAFGWTGHDAVYDYDEEPPEGQIFFAGPPKRIADPAPGDVRTLVKGSFAVGYSPALGHGVWAAYHVPREAKFEQGKRPGFKKDRAVASCPPSSAYDRTGYDRGHLAPNHAIATRFGPEEQEKTFLLTNVSPQSPGLNRGPWREIERRIADLWTERYGEIWVIAGTRSDPDARSRETLSGTRVDVPTHYWVLIVAQNEEGLRALALIMPQSTPYGHYPVHSIVTVEELESFTGWQFLPHLPEYIARPVKSDRPTRLWPIRWRDAFTLLSIRLGS